MPINYFGGVPIQLYMSTKVIPLTIFYQLASEDISYQLSVVKGLSINDLV